MRPDPLHFLPLKDLVFRILVALSDGERHGWSLVQALDDRAGGAGILPGHLYRTLNRMLDDGLIEERDRPAKAQATRSKQGAAPSRFFSLTPLGCDVARAETRRLESLVAKSRAGRLLKAKSATPALKQ
jgi:DNA-binding PadR family transcriptional regulator